MPGREAIVMLAAALIWLYKVSLHTFPAQFQENFAEEMTDVFERVLAQAASRGWWALLGVGLHEFCQLPLAIWRAHLAVWRGKQAQRPLTRTISRSPFHPLPPAHDGRFSWRQLALEMLPLVATAVCLFILTYHRPDVVPANWQHQWPGLGWFTMLFALPLFCLGLAWGLPRWAYPAGGLLLGYSLLLIHWFGLISFWAGLLLAAFIVGLTAVHSHLHHQPLPPFLQRIGRSMALDWARLCFGLYGLMPWLLIVAFDGVYRTDRTPYLALSLLLMVLGVLVYGRCQRQQQQWMVLLTAVSVTLLPPLLHQAAFQGGVWRWLADPARWLADLSWIGVLWAFQITLLLLPMLARLIYQTWTEENSRADGEVHL